MTLKILFGTALILAIALGFAFARPWIWTLRFWTQSPKAQTANLTPIPTCLGCNLLVIDFAPIAQANHLNAFAKRAFVFRRAYANTPERKINQEILRTSRFPKPSASAEISPTLTQLFRERGYRTFYFGREPAEDRQIQTSHLITDGLDRLTFSETLIKSEPFFGYLDFHQAENSEATSARSLEVFDRQIGLIWSTLEGLDKIKNTMIVVVSTEPSTQTIPLLIYHPEAKEPATIDELISLVDVMPLILNLFGAPAPSQAEGRSLMEPARAHLVFGFEPDGRYAFDGDWKLKKKSDGSEALYYLPLDPEARENLANLSVEPAQQALERLRAELSGWSSTHP